MKNLSIFLLAASVLVAGSAMSLADDDAKAKERERIAKKWEGHTGSVPWIIGFEEGMAEAEFSGKPAIVFFTATW